MHYLEFVLPSRRTILFKSTAKIFRSGYDVIVEADGVLHEVGVDLTVSRRTSDRDAHAVIFVEGGKVYIRDLGSTNGTHVNGKRIESSKPIEISPIDTITIGYYTTVRVVPKPTEEAIREKRDSRDIMYAMLLYIDNCLIKLYQKGIEEGLAEFSLFQNTFEELLKEPCKLPQEICKAYNEAYDSYRTLERDKYARASQYIIDSFEKALTKLKETLERTLISYPLLQ